MSARHLSLQTFNRSIELLVAIQTKQKIYAFSNEVDKQTEAAELSAGVSKKITAILGF